MRISNQNFFENLVKFINIRAGYRKKTVFSLLILKKSLKTFKYYAYMIKKTIDFE